MIWGLYRWLVMVIAWTLYRPVTLIESWLSDGQRTATATACTVLAEILIWLTGCIALAAAAVFIGEVLS